MVAHHAVSERFFLKHFLCVSREFRPCLDAESSGAGRRLVHFWLTILPFSSSHPRVQCTGVPSALLMSFVPVHRTLLPKPLRILVGSVEVVRRLVALELAILRGFCSPRQERGRFASREWLKGPRCLERLL